MSFSSSNEVVLKKILDAIRSVQDVIETIKNQGGRMDRTELDAIKDYADRLQKNVNIYGRPSSELMLESKRLFEVARVFRGHAESRFRKLGIKMTILCNPSMMAMNAQKMSCVQSFSKLYVEPIRDVHNTAEVEVVSRM